MEELTTIQCTTCRGGGHEMVVDDTGRIMSNNLCSDCGGAGVKDELRMKLPKIMSTLLENIPALG